MSRFLDGRFAALDPYVPGEQPQDMHYVKLNTNESPYPPSPLVLRALSPDNIQKLNLYPDPDALDIRGAIASFYGLKREQVIAGNGSDELLAFCFQAFCGDRGACFPDISYGFYPVFAALYGVDAKAIPLREDFGIAPEDYYHAGRTIFIANPNAPTGKALPIEAIRAILKNNPDTVVVIDEAYVDFGAQSAVPLISEFENLIVVQTFSKSRSLAGMRLGMAMGSAALICDLNTMKFSFNPYNTSRLAALAGVAAMKDASYFKQCCTAIQRTRTAATAQLKAQGFFILPSCANFVFASHPEVSGAALYKELKARGVLVRWFDKPRLREHLRITIGSDAQMRTLLQTTKDILEESL